MVTRAKRSTTPPINSRAVIKLSPNASRRMRVLTHRASTQIGQLHLLVPLYLRTERILAPEGLKRMRDTSGIPVAQKEAGALLYALNHELVLFISQLADTLAALQAEVADTAKQAASPGLGLDE